MGALSSRLSLSAWLPSSLTLKTQWKGGPVPWYLQGAVGLDTVVAQAAAPAGTEDRDAMSSVCVGQTDKQTKKVWACSHLPRTTANRFPLVSHWEGCVGKASEAQQE